MNQTISTIPRIVSITFSTNGFGFAVMEEEDSFVDFGAKDASGDKNAESLSKVKKLINRYQPEVLVLQDVSAKDFHRAPRIKTLQQKIVKVALLHKLKVVTFSGTHVRTLLLNDPKGTRHEVAAVLANQFPNELGSRLPPKRKAWESENRNMDMFDAIGLAMVFWSERMTVQ